MATAPWRFLFCCCGPCWTAADDFNRADSTDLGSKWIEEPAWFEGDPADDAEIVDNQLVIHSGQARFLPTGLGHTGALRACVDIVNCQDGETVAFRIWWLKNDGTQRQYIEITLTPHEYPAPSVIAFHQRLASGSEGTIYISEPQDCEDWWEHAMSIPNGSSVRLQVCFSGTTLVAAVVPTTTACFEMPEKPHVACIAEQDETGWTAYAALATGISNDATFDNFQIEDHFSHNEKCSSCHCDGTGTLVAPTPGHPHTVCPPDQLTLTVTHDSGCETTGPATFPAELTLYRIGNRANWNTHRGYIECTYQAPPPTGDKPVKIHFLLKCSGDPQQGYTLEVGYESPDFYDAGALGNCVVPEGNTSIPHSWGWELINPISTQFDPLILEFQTQFGNWCCQGNSGPPDPTFRIIITE